MHTNHTEKLLGEMQGKGGQCQGVGPGDGDRVTLGPPLLLCKLHFMQILDNCHKWKAQHRGGNFGCLWVPLEGFVLEEESLKLQPPHKRTGRVMPRWKGAGGQCAGGGSRLRSGHSHTLERAGVVGVPLHARLLVHLGMETTKSSCSVAMSQEN